MSPSRDRRWRRTAQRTDTVGIKLARARLAVALAGRRPLVPLTALFFAVIGVFASHRNDASGSWAVTSLLGFGLASWLVAAVEREVPEATDAILVVAAGGPRAAWRGALTLAAAMATLVTVTFVAYPLIRGAFEKPPDATDVAATVLLHFTSAGAGGALALVLAPPIRLATAFVLTLVVLLATVALSEFIGPLAGPGGAAQAFSTMPRGAFSESLFLALVMTTLITTALLWLVRISMRRRG